MAILAELQSDGFTNGVKDVDESDAVNGFVTARSSHGLDSGTSSFSARASTSPKGNGPHSDLYDDPICVVGMACRLPGDIRSPAELWDFLRERKSAQSLVPRQRFNIEAFYHPDGSRAGVMNANGGYFLNEDVRLFDNSFFGINAMEATYMDPQQRKLLELVFECFESSGLSMEQVSGSNTGVYVGNFTVDYQTMQTRDPDYMHRYHATGSGTSIMSNRISHVFNLLGPSMTIDTACSSSMYCLHSAVNAIRSGECDGAVVAAANLITAPEQHLGTMKGGVLSPTSTCHTFDASADGYGRAEAVNAVYLKPLSVALKDGDKIWSIIRATAVNANGRTPGITLPSAKYQEMVIRKAYASSNLLFDDTDYIECHGTGTAVGDPIEVEGLQACFGPRSHPLKIGSVKSSLGHSEAASGLTSLIKVSMAFDKGKIPPTYGLRELNSKIDLSKANMSVTVEVEDWPRDRRRASINSFGYGGANAHVVVESLDSYLNQCPQVSVLPPNDPGQILAVPVSAASETSLDARKRTIDGLLRYHDAQYAKNLAYTLSRVSPCMKVRSLLLARTSIEGKVELVDNGESLDNAVKLANIPLAFIFNGQGAQYPQMGMELLQNNECFQQTIRELDNTLRTLPSAIAPTWSLEDELLTSPTHSNINHATHSQPTSTAIQIGLVNVLRLWGIKPIAVMGHSSGEIAAAYAAGLLSAKEAILASYFRGIAVGNIRSEGAMIAAGIGPEAAQQLLVEFGLQDDVCVACINSPQSVTLSGCKQAAELLLAELHTRKTFARKLFTGGRAYHSHLVTEVGQLYEELLGPYLDEKVATTKSPSVKMVSSVANGRGQLVLDVGQGRTAKYWRDNLEKPVEFSGALQKLLQDEKPIHLIEIGAHPALKGPIQQVLQLMGLEKNLVPYNGSLVRGQDADLAMKRLVASLFQRGHHISWEHVNHLASHDQVALYNIPTYPWDYSAGLHWYEPRASIDLRNRRYPRHELLGSPQLAGSGIDWSWRNVLRLSEAKWLLGHKIESQIVIPAAAYLAIAIEALVQINGPRDRVRGKAFQFRNVALKSALVVQEKGSADATSTEIHTILTAQKISTKSSSNDWFEFGISSWAGGRSTLHCSGSIRMRGSMSLVDTTTVHNSDTFDMCSMERWYKKLADSGLCFGPDFRSLTSLRTDSNRTRTDAVATTVLKTKAGETTDTEYFVHPISIDACLQAAIMGGTAGDLASLRAFIPTFIAECHIQAVEAGRDQDATIFTSSSTTSPSTRRIDCTLVDASGNLVVDMKNSLLSLYTGKIGHDKDDKSLFSQRQPILRVDWKPDILRLPTNSFRLLGKYIDEFIKDQDADSTDNETSAIIGALLDLIGHNNPGFRGLYATSGCSCATNDWLSILHKETSLPRVQSWKNAIVRENGEIAIENETAGPFDVLVLSRLSDAERLWATTSDQLLSLIEGASTILTRNTNSARDKLTNAGFTVVEIKKQILFGVKQAKVNEPIQGHDFLITYKNPSMACQDFFRSLSDYLRVSGAHSVKCQSLTDLHKSDITAKTVCISLLEIEQTFLATLSVEDMNALRLMTDTVGSLLWLTGADVLGEPNPDLTLSNGLSRALMLEQPSLRFSILDIGPLSKVQPLSTFSNVEKVLTVFNDIDDKEFIQVDEILYTSRFRPDFEMNKQFRRHQGGKEHIQMEILSMGGAARLAITQPGTTSSLHFQRIRKVSTLPPPGFIDVDLKAVSLNAKDIYTMSGHVETRTGTAALEFCGVVTAVGPDVGGLQVGDRVVVMAPNYFTTNERVPAWSTHKMLPDEQDHVLCTIPIAYATALYALHDRGNLRPGESVLVHAGAGAVGTAAITLAKLLGATVYTTCSSQSKRDYLTNDLAVPASHIFNSRDTSFVEGIRTATKGRGVDLVINSLVGDMMHSSWECLATFGRFVEIGKRELVDAGKLQMDMFLKDTTFTAFDLSDLFYHEDQHYRDIWIARTKQALELYRSGKVRPGPSQIYDVSNISEAFRAFSAKDRIGKIVVSMSDKKSIVPMAPARYLSEFDPEKIYLLVGCLGGLGRSLSRWMLQRGARNFAFIGRSGADKPRARSLVDHLESIHAKVVVARGDVTSLEDCQAFVRASLATGKTIGGLIQAAMGLHESLFSRMSHEAWHTGVQPKWKGTWNLHTAIEGHESHLDFFLLMSSVSGSVATATESNYCAANGFLDAWARWRRTQGKKAVSVGLGMISEVGYLHDNPEIEALLLRKGIQPLNEEDFLRIIDLALSGPSGGYAAQDQSPAGAHMLTGLESQALRKLMDQGWDVSSGNATDPRSSVLSASLFAEISSGAVGNADSDPTYTAPWLKTIPKAVAKALAVEAAAGSLVQAILALIQKRFSSLILLPTDRIDAGQNLARFGVDSMIAAEFRTWIWNTFKVDIPFLNLLSNQETLTTLAEAIGKALVDN